MNSELMTYLDEVKHVNDTCEAMNIAKSSALCNKYACVKFMCVSLFFYYFDL